MGDAVEEFERFSMTGQPGGYLLVDNDLGVHVPAEAQSHDENPSFDLMATAECVDNVRPLAKVHLGGFCGCKIQHARCVRFGFFDFL